MAFFRKICKKKMIKKDQKKLAEGFTIIELIVVIAIIAVLASIILVSISNYNYRAKNAAIKGNLANLLRYGSVYYSNNVNYDGFCNDPKALTFLNAASKVAIPNPAAVCQCDTANCVSAKAWCAYSLSFAPSQGRTDATSSKVFCVDSTGAKKEGWLALCLNGACQDPVPGY